MVAFEGDQEATLAPFETLEDASTPKLGCCALLVDDLDAAVADFGRIYDMAFVPADPQGLGSRAMVGKHRVKLIQRGASDFTAEFRGPLAAFEVMYDDVEAQRSEEHTSELQSLMRISYAVFCLKKNIILRKIH